MSILSLPSWFLEYMELALFENKEYLQFTFQNTTSNYLLPNPCKKYSQKELAEWTTGPESS